MSLFLDRSVGGSLRSSVIQAIFYRIDSTLFTPVWWQKQTLIRRRFYWKLQWLKNLDPAYHFLLEAGRQAWLECRHDHVAADRVGVVIGNIVLPGERSSAYSDAFFRARFEEQLFPAKKTSFAYEWMDRYIAGMPATLLAQALGIAGGAWDTGCRLCVFVVCNQVCA